ncbi:hypothetical protein J6590_056703 [Homalodisca vitripennis]|nr:hypothetical protein J6590_056703 [Homalodisca vitripennis]
MSHSSTTRSKGVNVFDIALMRELGISNLILSLRRAPNKSHRTEKINHGESPASTGAGGKNDEEMCQRRDGEVRQHMLATTALKLFHPFPNFRTTFVSKISTLVRLLAVGLIDTGTKKECWRKWMKEKKLPNLEPNSLGIVNNASYYNIQIGKGSTSQSMKQDMKAQSCFNNIVTHARSLIEEFGHFGMRSLDHVLSHRAKKMQSTSSTSFVPLTAEVSKQRSLTQHLDRVPPTTIKKLMNRRNEQRVFHKYLAVEGCDSTMTDNPRVPESCGTVSLPLIGTSVGVHYYECLVYY